jgi:hypothetical protein
MSKLPERPDLGQLKKKAKELLADARAGRPGALERIGAENASEIALHDAQRAVAREHGFPSWAKLKFHLGTANAEAAEAVLVQAALGGDPERVAALLADKPALGTRSIHAAAALGDAAGVRSWLERDPALANAKGGAGGWPPIIFLCFGRVGGDDPARAEAAHALLANDADPNAWRGDPAWPKARETALYGATGVNSYPVLARVLLVAGADPNDGESRYHAPEKNHVACLEVLEEFGTDFSRVDPEWRNTPLFFLLGWGAPPAPVVSGIRWLLGHGADPNVPAYPERLRETPIHLAVRNGWGLDMIALLLDHGADPAIRRKDGRSAYALAVRSGRDDAAALLRERGGAQELDPVDVFLGACLRADEAAARRCLERKPELMAALSHEERLFVHEAARQGRVAALELMQALGFDLGIKGETDTTAMHVAGWHGRAEALGFLIRQGCDVNAIETQFGGPPIGWVAHGSQSCRDPAGDYAAAAQALLGAGAKVPPGMPASPEVAEVLRRHGAA